MSEKYHVTVNLLDLFREDGESTWDKFVNHCFRRGFVDIDPDEYTITLRVDSVSYISEIDSGVGVKWFNRMCRLFETTMKNHGITVDGYGSEFDIESYHNYATMRFSLLKGRTEISDYIFDDYDTQIEFRDYDNLVKIARKKVRGLKCAIVYVKGPTLALVALQDACRIERVKLSLYFYDYDYGWTSPEILKYFNHESR